MAVVRAYPSYQPIHSRWVPSIPEHWSLLRAKNFLREVDDRSSTGEETLLSMRMLRGLVPHNNVSVKRIAPESLIGYKKARSGDLVLNRMQAGNAMFFCNNQPGLVSPDYAVFRLLRDDNPEYLGHLFRSWPMRGLFRSESKGLGTGTSGFLRLYSDRFMALEIPLPPRPEQDQIVAYLRAQDAHIARFIKTKYDLIKLLTEQKLRIIDRAVTRGLDATVTLKPSGIEWLGEVPEHWEISRLGACIKTIRAGVWGSDPSDKNLSDQLVCVRVADFDMEKLAVGTSKLTVRAVSQNERSGRLLCPGDILLEKSGGGEKTPVGRVVAFTLDKVSVCSNFLARLVPNTQLIRSAFLLTVMNHLHARRIVIPYIKQTTGIQNLDSTAYFKLGIALPSLNEQDEILQALAQDCNPIEEAIQRANDEIKLIREYRDRLIADVVTGQIDVRGWQPDPEDVVDDALLSALGDENEEVTEEEDDDGED